ncbi:alanyl-tRNA editing protein Aarsd1-like [Malaya genurostris]|uniref:alanyl-tRNA editing protein Aarsd1-like n=1 Tax=Malaya genurostris TaxID=325434 RepID=UPI0026F3FD13|nr:alanyl-tRNA editing protein Aarsd1-like [Malaya genurostris]
MVFKCQEDSFLKEFSTTVITCEKTDHGFNVICEDTVLFPEGGGQPSDHGWLNDYEVKSVTRKGPDAIHFVEGEQAPFLAGDRVHQRINWERRFDHMQQHSGQHLITAIFDKELGYSTRSWWLGTEDSYVDLDAKDVTREQLEEVEKICNQLIVACTPVTVDVYQPNDPELKSGNTRTRGLPDDVSGPLRVVTIDGIEKNMCCGTHVKNLAQLQAMKFLNVEKSKNKCLVHFLVGNRIVRKLTECYDREIQFNNLLNGGPSSHIDLIKKLQVTVKSIQKSSKKLSTELAVHEAEKINSLDPKPKFYAIHRTDGADSDFINVFLRNIKLTDCFFFLTNGDESGKGQLLLYGKPEEISLLGEDICKILDGKGTGKGSRFNAKVNKLKPSNLDQCQKLVEQYFNLSTVEK